MVNTNAMFLQRKNDKFSNYGEWELDLTNCMGTVELQAWILLLIDTKNT